MKALLTVLLVSFSVATSFAQATDKSINTIDVLGSSKILANPPNYVAQVLIEEEEQKVGYTTIGKLPIDSIKMSLAANLKKFGFEEKELKILGVSGRPLGQYPNFLTNIAYELKLKDKETASKLVNEMRFPGLKGIVIKRVFTQAQKTALSDSLYTSAIQDARKIATELAKRENKTIGEVKSIELRFNSVASFGMDTDSNTGNFNAYEFSKFEMDYRDKYANCNVRVVFEWNRH